MRTLGALVFLIFAGISPAAAQPEVRACEALAGAGRTLCHEVEAPVSSAAAWALWTSSEGLASWMAPMAVIDLRTGGEIEASYDPAARAGDRGNIRNRIASFLPERMLAIEIAHAPPGFPHAEEARRLWTVITFEPTEAGTRVRVWMLGFADGEAFEALRAFFERGNAATLAAFARRAAQEEAQ